VLEVTGLNPPLPPDDVLVLEVGLKPLKVDDAALLPLDGVLVLEVGLKPPNADEAAPLPFDVLALGLKPPKVDEAAPLLDSLNADGWNPDFEDSSAGAGAVFTANMLLCSEGVDGLLLIALANRLEVAVAGGLNLEEDAVDCGVGVAGTSAGRARFDGEASRASGLSWLTLRFVDKADSWPVIPFSAARCFFAMSIFFLIAELCW
jgi:hypothetical protein